MKRSKNKVTVEVDDLDIYVAEELKNKLAEVLKKSPDKAILNLAKVKRISTPALQVILSAGNSFDELNVTDLCEEIASDLKMIGVAF
ncbi:MAG: hypothetical protein IMF07_08315 [Proteobacteria bacterium]|nr:hypothetical protein [Pseudomonadota bacterium]